MFNLSVYHMEAHSCQEKKNKQAKNKLKKYLIMRYKLN